MKSIQFKQYSFEQLLFEVGLYKKILVDFEDFTSGSYKEYESGFSEEYWPTIYTTKYSEDFQHLIDFLQWEKNFFGFCPFCKKETSLKPQKIELQKELLDSNLHHIHEDQIDDYNGARSEIYKRIILLNEKQFISKNVGCMHNSDHKFTFFFQIKFKTKNEKQFLEFEKIGQSSSLSDFFEEGAKKYKKLLMDIDCYNDFVTGCRMYAHGTAIASYTYLRRVFEKLIYYIFEDHKSELNIEQKKFAKLRMEEKITKLQNYLPSFLTENDKNIYKILSAGIHHLSEEDCENMFPILKNAISIILKQKQDEIDDNLLKNETRKSLNDFTSKIYLN